MEASKKGKLAKISLYKPTDNAFFQDLKTDFPADEFAIETDTLDTITALEKKLEPYDTLLISLFVPKAKPMNNFDIDTEVLTFLEEIFLTKKCVLYVFGNPYALQVIPNLKSAVGVVQVYQDFTEFQESGSTAIN